MASVSPSNTPSRRQRKPKPLPGIAREDSDDELGTDDLPWEWIYDSEIAESPSRDDANSRKRKRGVDGPRIVGARTGSFQCKVGDTVLLKAEGSGEAWIGIIWSFKETEEGEKMALFLWFSSEKEIRNKTKKRTDFHPNELYITPSTDENPLESINGTAQVMSWDSFHKKYPTGKVPRKAKEFGKVFICRRGCSTRTATYTEEFNWEDIYRGPEDIDELYEKIKTETKATRRRRNARDESPEREYVVGQDPDEDAALLRTPKKARTQDVSTPSKRKTPSKAMTPSHRKIMVKKHLEFTPLATRVLSPSHHQASPYQIARSQLHVASVPTSLPCREAEFSLVYSHLEAAITDGTGSCIYISGTPGTGKTATVREVVTRLDEAVRSDELDDFIFVEINGMKITDPHQAYSLLWEALKGQRVSPSQALDLLEREFSHPSPRRVPCVVLMDELDQLVTKNQGVMYNFFNWPGLRHSRLIVLAVANTMDLPERTLSNKISSRLGLTRITFPGYNHEQLMRIVQSRLSGVPGTVVDPDAIQFASRKVAAVSGDARRALDICRRAVELAEAESRDDDDDDTPATPSKRKNVSTQDTPGKKKKASAGRVTIDTVRRAINEATSNPLQLYLRALPFASRMFLSALLSRTQRTGLAESSYGDVLEEMQRKLKLLAASGGSRPLALMDSHQQQQAEAGNGSNNNKNSSSNLMMMGTTPSSRARQDASHRANQLRPAGMGAAAVELMGAGIVYLEGARAERPSKLRLAVGDEEVRLAFRDDGDIKALGMLS